MTAPIVLGISGPSGSGKSTVAAALAQSLPGSVHLQQDLFFVDPDLCDPDSNFCEPRYLRVDEFLDTAARLASGKEATLPVIDFFTFRRVGTSTLSSARTSLVIIEGMTIFRFAPIISMCDLRYYLTPPVKVVVERKLSRDSADRGKSREHLANQMTWVASEYMTDLSNLEPGGHLHVAGVEPVDSANMTLTLRTIRSAVASLLDIARQG